MISMEERKIALLIQTNLIKRELENLKNPEYLEAQMSSYNGRNTYAGFIALVDSLESKEK